MPTYRQSRSMANAKAAKATRATGVAIKNNKPNWMNSATAQGKCGARNTHPMRAGRLLPNEHLVARAGKSMAD